MLNKNQSHDESTLAGFNLNPSKGFSNLFNAYSKAINKGYNRTGSLFEKPFRRIPVTDDSYLSELIFYIHYNPQKHRFISDFTKWRWSSYRAAYRGDFSIIVNEGIIDLFGSRQAFVDFHRDRAIDRESLDNIDDFD